MLSKTTGLKFMQPHDYGSQLYATASKHVLQSLDAAHNKAIRLSSGAFKSPMVSSYAKSREQPSKYRLRQLVLLQYARIKRFQLFQYFYTFR